MTFLSSFVAQETPGQAIAFTGHGLASRHLHTQRKSVYGLAASKSRCTTASTPPASVDDALLKVSSNPPMVTSKYLNLETSQSPRRPCIDRSRSFGLAPFPDRVITLLQVLLSISRNSFLPRSERVSSQAPRSDGNRLRQFSCMPCATPPVSPLIAILIAKLSNRTSASIRPYQSAMYAVPIYSHRTLKTYDAPNSSSIPSRQASARARGVVL